MSQINFEKEYRHFLINNFPNLLITSVLIKNTVIVSCGVQKTEPIDIEQLKETTKKFYHTWLEKKEVKQVLKLGCVSDFISLDPRIGSQEEPSHLLKMLFEGLTRIGPDGTPQNALARKIEVSESELCYRFYLRKSRWSNGMPLTAHDFAHAWRISSVSPLSYLFYPIKNALAVKECLLPQTALGIRAVDTLTLEVELEHPTPYFLELCAHSSFSPVCRIIDLENPSWPSAKGKGYVCNGPFRLEHSSSKKDIILTRNLSYWNAAKVHIEKVIISKVREEDAQTLFEEKKLDMIPYPFCKRQNIDLTTQSSNERKPGVLDHRYLSLNCMKPPFSCRKLREAFSLALQREILAPYFASNSVPLYSIYSPDFSQIQLEKDTEKKLKIAQQLFSQSLKELGHKRTVFNNEKLYTAPSSAKGAQQIVTQLNAAFGLNLTVAVVDASELFRLIIGRKINLFLFLWINRIKDPIYFLETFSLSSDIINYSQWESAEIYSLIQSIKKETDKKIRKGLHLQAEKILNREKPLIPLVSTQIYSSIPSNLKGVITTNSHNFDICFSRKI